MRQGEIIGLKYRILKPIGQGGNSTVFLGENIILSNLWAIKVIDRDNPSAVGEMQEVNILKCLNHPMLPRVADLFEDERYTYIVMDYIEGETLSEVLKKEGKIDEKRLTDWARQLCNVLIYLHSRNPPVIYRDLKPSNIILDGAGKLHLVDFGTAKTFSKQETEDTVYIGTQGYAAPEQYGCGKADERTDLYNLGMTLFHLATGIHPAKAVHGDIERLLRQYGISRGFSTIIRDLVRPDPSARIGDADTCLKLLNRLDSTGHFSVRAANRGVFAGRLTVGVAGVVHGSGSTFAGICLASYFAARGYRTAFMDYCGNGDLSRLEEVMDKNNRLIFSDEVSFVADQITYFRDGRNAVGSVRGFSRIVGDFGCLREQWSAYEFSRSDIRLVVCPAADWKLGLINDFISRMGPYDPDGEWIYIFPAFGNSDKRQIQKALKTNHVLTFPFVSNPFRLTGNEQKNIRDLLYEAMKISGIEYKLA